MQTNVVIVEPTLNYSRDHAEMLRISDANYRELDDHFLQIGEITKIQGWIVHLSVIKTQVPQLMEKILPMLLAEKISFKISKNYRGTQYSLNGDLGYHLLGKVITIYYEDEESLVPFIRKLMNITHEFKGPSIPTDAHLGGIVYVRYGGFNPILQLDAAGATRKYIYEGPGNLVEDTYYVPFLMPDKTAWPFGDIAKAPSKKIKNILANNYLITATLKSNVKGEVFKALRVNRYFPEWCVIKEGKHDMWSDDYGRDVQERLRYQYEMQKDLYGHVSIPEPYGLFQEKEGTYLVMQYVKGRDWGDVVNDIHNHRSWGELPRDEKKRLLDYLLQIIDQCEKLHQKGYIHRDLALTNFILNKKDRLVMIDLELGYFKNDEKRRRPFRLGTPGFMSPEQIKTAPPTEKEDIYALGAVMIHVLTGIHPVKFGLYFTHELTESLCILTENERIANLITQCMQANPIERPSLQVIRETLKIYREELPNDTFHRGMLIQKDISTFHASKVLKESLNGLCHLLSSDPLQLKYKEIEDSTRPTSALSLGWYNGLSGALYLLAKAAPYLPESNLEAAFTRGLEYIRQRPEENIDTTDCGLYSGTAGIALTIAEGLKSGFLKNTQEQKHELWGFLKPNNSQLNFAHGIAGQGMTILQCMSYLDKNSASLWLQQHVNIILDSQQKDGSWKSGANFALGHSGIVLFLLAYLEFNPESRVFETLYKALNWMCTRPAKTAASFTWLTKNNYKKINVGLDGELAGIALSSLFAYQKLKDPLYKICAEEILFQVPHNLVCQDFSLASGLSGLGHVYLEAWSQLKNDEWRNRADTVATLLARSSYRENATMRYWVVIDDRPAYGDLMSGAGGVMYFLLRYLALNNGFSNTKTLFTTPFSVDFKPIK